MLPTKHQATEKVTIELRYGLWVEVCRFCAYCRFDPFEYLAWLIEDQSKKGAAHTFPFPPTRDMERLHSLE